MPPDHTGTPTSHCQEIRGLPPPSTPSLHSSLIPADWAALSWYKGPVSRAIGKTNTSYKKLKKWIYSKWHSHHAGMTVLFMGACNSMDCSYAGTGLKFFTYGVTCPSELQLCNLRSCPEKLCWKKIIKNQLFSSFCTVPFRKPAINVIAK